MNSLNDEAKRFAINAFILLHIVVIASLSIPFNPHFAAATRSQLGRYANRTGLFQSWDMFAPDPMNANSFLDAEITCRDGKKRSWTFPQMQDLGYVERYFKERYRKFANDRLSLDSNSALWPDAARYIARLHADASNPPESVKLIYHWSVIPPPPSQGQVPETGQWGHRVLFTYTVNAGDLP